MTKEKIGVADKVGGIEPLLGSSSSGRGLACKELVSTICGQRPGPVHGLSWGSQALNSEVAFRDFLIVVDR
jgi:hypothetical protein